MDPDNLTWDHLVAAGAFGEVWIGTWALLPYNQVAIKKMFTQQVGGSGSSAVADAFGEAEMCVLAAISLCVSAT